MFGFVRALKRRWLARRELPASFLPLIDQHFPFAEQLAPAEKQRFMLHLKVFALDKHFEGAGGLEVTDEMKVVVAGSAARRGEGLRGELAAPRPLARDDRRAGAGPLGGEALGVIHREMGAVIRGELSAIATDRGRERERTSSDNCA